MKRYTEKDTANYYDQEDVIYRSFWDPRGSLHWGYFLNSTDSFLKASRHLTSKMIHLGRVTSSSRVLDVGCGNGTTAIEIARKTRCAMTGIDLSAVRIQRAKEKLDQLPVNEREQISFFHTTATKLPFRSKIFTHVWSQATIYHVQNKTKALREMCRVLKSDGIFIFDDLLKPKKNISHKARKNIYDRLLFETPFSFVSYQIALEKIRFQVLYAENLSQHLKQSYVALQKVLERKIEQEPNNKYVAKYKNLIHAYKVTAAAVDSQEVGWGLYICRKTKA